MKSAKKRSFLVAAKGPFGCARCGILPKVCPWIRGWVRQHRKRAESDNSCWAERARGCGAVSRDPAEDTVMVLGRHLPASCRARSAEPSK